VNRNGWSWQRGGAVVAGCVALGILGMRGERVPLLGLVDLGFHELGHLICYLLPVGELVTAAAGSFVQVAVPLGLAVYFLALRRDRVGGAACLAWAATSALDASRYIADAPYERLPLIGGEHDWAFFFSAEVIDAMHRAGSVAAAVSTLAWVLYVTAFAVALAAPLLAPARRPAAVPSSSVGGPVL
jgi:hypothetical protein